MNRIIILTTRIVSIGAFIVSLRLDIFCISSRCIDALTALLMGWIMIITGGANFAWLSNLSLVISWVMIGENKRITHILTVVGIVLGLLPLMTGELAVDEAGTLRQIQSFELGYWLWISSMAIVLTGTLLSQIKMKN